MINKSKIRAALNMDAPQAIPVPEIAQKVSKPVTTCYFKTVDDVLAKVRESKDEHAEKFFAYFEQGEVDKYNSGDESSADESFCVMLAYWTNRDAEMMDEVFRLSKLMRTRESSPEKFWDQRHGAQTYGELTIANAIRFSEERDSPTFTGAAIDLETLAGNKWPDIYVLPDLNDATEPVEAPVSTNTTAVKPFPFQVFAPEAVTYGQALIKGGLPAEYVWPAILAVLSLAVGGMKSIKLDSWEQFPILWIVLDGEPGTAKTPTMQNVRRPLNRAQKQYTELYAREMREWEKADKKERGDHPTLTRLLMSDFTMEALLRKLTANPAGIGIWDDEIAAILNGFGQYKNKQGNDRQRALRLWSGGAIEYDRADGTTLFAERPVLNILGGVQPEILHEVLDGADGMRERFLISHFPGRAQPPRPHQKFVTEEAGWFALVMRILSRREQLNIRGFGPEEIKWFDGMRRRKYDLTQAAYQTQSRSLWLGKMEAHILSIALILDEIKNPGASLVSLKALKQGEAVFQYFDAQSHALPYHAPNQIAPPWVQSWNRAADQLAIWLGRQPDQQATTRQIQRARIAGVRNVKETTVLVEQYGINYPGCLVEQPLGNGTNQKTKVCYAPSRAGHVE